jgi:hypothetical protein
MQGSHRTALLITWNLGLTIAAIAAWRHAATLTVERIDIVDHNGTRRMAITNRDRLPNVVIDGKQGVRTDRIVQPAGIVVYDEQGNEGGGFATTRLADGADASMLVLDYGRSEAIGIVQRHSATSYRAALVINDPPAPGARDDQTGTERISVATADRVSAIELKDRQGRARIRLSVDASDQPAIAILDEAGRVISRLPTP